MEIRRDDRSIRMATEIAERVSSIIGSMVRLGFYRNSVGDLATSIEIPEKVLEQLRADGIYIKKYEYP
jgi:hypothetical protein